MNITRTALDAVADHARSEYPNECCGVLLGIDGTICTVVPTYNNHPGDHRNNYEISDSHLATVYDIAALNHLEVLGIFHSHCDMGDGAYFSHDDLRTANPWWLYLVVGVYQGAVAALAAYRPHDTLQWASVEKVVPVEQ